MIKPSTYLVFGATGGTGQHFVSMALADGHRVRALVRDPAKLTARDDRLDVHVGSVVDYDGLDGLTAGVDFIAIMLGDVAAQRTSLINLAFMQRLLPAMRRQGVRRLLYQAGALSRPWRGRLPPVLWAIRHTLAAGYAGQHRDNEAVMQYLAEHGNDIDWIVHRAGIGSDGPSRGRLARSTRKFSVGTFRDCAAYNYRILGDDAAIRTADFSHYERR